MPRKWIFTLLEETFLNWKHSNYLIKDEANVVWDHIWDENASIGNVTDTFEKLESRVDESKYVYNKAVPT